MKIMLDPGVVAWSAASRKIDKLVVFLQYVFNKCWTFVLYCTVLYCTAVVVGFYHSSVAVAVASRSRPRQAIHAVLSLRYRARTHSTGQRNT